jgi:3-oxoacyl-[acyl-carrier protein] reductase
VGTLKNKVALVTGGSRGIGEAICKELARNGFIVYAGSRSAVRDGNEGSCIPLSLDLTDEAGIIEAVRFIEQAHGTLDVLVNNAGIMANKPFEELEPNEWKTVYQTNVLGPLLCMQQSFRLMKANGGRIINISSIMTEKPLPFTSVYTSSKQALNGLADALAEEWYRHRIFLTNILLGATYTDLWKEAEGFSADDMLSVEDVARTVAFVAQTSLRVRMDAITMTPPKGVL